MPKRKDFCEYCLNAVNEGEMFDEYFCSKECCDKKLEEMNQIMN